MEKHVIVVGAGVAGLTTAYYLNKAGLKVTVCEQYDGTDNCSYGNAGLIAPRHIIPIAAPGVISQGLKWMLKKESPFYIKPRFSLELMSWLWKFKKAATEKQVKAVGPILKKMLYRNQELVAALESDESLHFDYVKKGHLTVCETDKGLASASRSAQKAVDLGVPAEVLSAKEVLDLEPNISIDIKGGVYYPQDAHLHPGHLMKQFYKLLANKGVAFKTYFEVVNVKRINDNSVEAYSAKGEKISGTDVVLCNGAWLHKLAKKLDVNIPIQAGKGYNITLSHPVDRPAINLLLAEKKVAVTPMGEDLRFAGTMEIVGFDKSITKEKVDALKKSILLFYPQFSLDDLEHEHVWVGLRPCSPDGMPYVGKINGYDNVFASGGCAMEGMSLGFVCGEMVAQLITTGKSGLTDPLTSPSRYNH